MTFEEVGGISAVVATAVTLAYASYRDLIAREVPEAVWIPAYLIAAISAAIKFQADFTPLRVILSLVPPLVYLTLFLAKLLGGADLLGLLLVSLTHLYEPLVPLTTYILSSLIPLPLIIINLVENALRHKGIMSGIRCVQGGRRALYLVGRPTRVSSFLEKRFVFLHTYPVEGGYICRSSVDVGLDFDEQKTAVLEALNKGLISPEDYLVYSPAIPHVVLICAAYLASLALVPYLRLLLYPLLQVIG